MLSSPNNILGVEYAKALLAEKSGAALLPVKRVGAAHGEDTLRSGYSSATAVRRAAAEGYSFVFDSSGRTLNEQPAVLCFPAGCDLTEAVIRELNRGRSGGPEAPAATEPVSSAVSQPSGLPASSGVPQEPNPQSGEDR